jgi:Anti-sigma-K factor rskA
MTHITPQSSPELWSELLTGYVIGDLTPAEMAIFEQYLAAHPEQQAELTSLMLPIDLLSLSLPADIPPASIRQKIMQTAAAEVATVKQTGKRPKIQFQPVRLWQTSIAGLGLFILAGLGWQNYSLGSANHRLSQSLVTEKHSYSRLGKDFSIISDKNQRDGLIVKDYHAVINLLQQPNNRLVPLKSSGKNPVGMGSLVVAPEKGSAVLSLQKVSSISPNQVYRVWVTMEDEDDEDDDIACGDFIPDAAGKVLKHLPFKDWHKITKVAITIENKSTVESTGKIEIES